LLRLLQNIYAHLIGTGAGLLFQILSIPLFLAAWGEVLYGEWLVISATVAILSFVDVGTTLALSNSVALDSATNNYRSAQEKLCAACSLQLLIVVTVVPAIGISTALFESIPLVSLEVLSGVDGKLLFLVLAIYTIINAFAAVLTALYQGEDNYSEGVRHLAYAKLVEYAGTIAALIVKAEPTQLAIIMATLRAAGLTVIAVRAQQKFKRLHLNVSRKSLKELSEAFKNGVSFSSLTIGNALVTHGFPMILNQVIGSKAVVEFSITRAACRVIIQAFSVLYASIWPEITRLMAKLELRRVVKLNRTISAATVWAAVTFTVFMLILGPTLIELWSRGAVVPSREIIFGFLVHVILGAIWTPCSVILSATNSHQVYSRYYIGASIISLPLAYVLSSKFGYGGAGIALSAVDALVLPYVLNHTLRIIGDSPVDFLVSLYRPQSLREALAYRLTK
jgi:O-antigen/teichoic acid export membrane protein